jgi:hypothetical protein
MREKKFWKRSVVSALAAAFATTLVGTAGASVAEGNPQLYRATLNPVPHDPAADAGSNVTGGARLSREGRVIKVRVRASGLSPSLPHAMHIHGKEAAGEIAMCPGADRRDDLVDDGLIETVEGLADYGGIQVSFTTSGDTSPDSGLALDRMPVAMEDGTLRYKRTLEIPRSVARHLGEKHIVIHGEDLDGDGQYGGRITALGAPLEAELPVACGEIKRTG